MMRPRNEADILKVTGSTRGGLALEATQTVSFCERERVLTFRFTLTALLIGFSAVSSASLADEINYDDPNLARTNHFVSEATSACLRYNSSPENFEKCLSAYSLENRDQETVVVAQGPAKPAKKAGKPAKSTGMIKPGGQTDFSSESPAR
jgi:hypothetical protein